MEQVTIEHMTLEELQAFVKEHNLPPVVKETVDAYVNEVSKKRPWIISSRDGLIHCGDLNALAPLSSSFFLRLITYYAGVCKSYAAHLGTCPLPGLSLVILDALAMLSYDAHIQDELYELLGDDYIAAYNMILGLESC